MSVSGRASFNGPKPLNREYCRVEWQGERFARSQLLWKFNRPLYAVPMRLQKHEVCTHIYMYAYVSRKVSVTFRKCFAIFVPSISATVTGERETEKGGV